MRAAWLRSSGLCCGDSVSRVMGTTGESHETTRRSPSVLPSWPTQFRGLVKGSIDTPMWSISVYRDFTTLGLYIS